MNSQSLIELAAQIQISSGAKVSLTAGEAQKLLEYANLLSRWTQRMDLVSSADISRIISEHILDSVAAFHCVSRGTSYLDIGSGAGLPGIVFSILNPEAEVILLEPREKRVIFLREARRVLELTNSKVEQGKLEEFELPKHAFNAVLRAVGMEQNVISILTSSQRQCVEEVSVSFVVSDAWNLTPTLNAAFNTVLNTDIQYMLPDGGRRGRVVTLNVSRETF